MSFLMHMYELISSFSICRAFCRYAVSTCIC